MVAEKSPELIAAEAELIRRQQEQWEESVLARNPEFIIGKTLSEAIVKAQREFIDEWDTSPDLVLIHPADLRLVRYWAVERRMGTWYVRPGEEECLPDNPTLRVMPDYYRERGTFLVTTRKNLERLGVKGSTLEWTGTV